MIIKAQVDAVNPAIWYLFNIVFIAGIQLGLLLLISTPAYIQLLVSNMQMEMSWVDRIFPRALVGLVLIEGLADHQQWGSYFH
jgi:steroid 5-alpha reductase family enzyme